MINYQQILKSFLETVHEISDPSFQERVWVKGIGPECSSFEEAICIYFDYNESIIKDYKLFGLSDLQLETLQEFDKKLRSFCDIVPEIVDEKKEILPNPEWHKIQHLAQNTLKTFDYKNTV